MSGPSALERRGPAETRLGDETLDRVLGVGAHAADRGRVSGTLPGQTYETQPDSAGPRTTLVCRKPHCVEGSGHPDERVVGCEPGTEHHDVEPAPRAIGETRPAAALSLATAAGAMLIQPEATMARIRVPKVGSPRRRNRRARSESTGASRVPVWSSRQKMLRPRTRSGRYRGAAVTDHVTSQPTSTSSSAIWAPEVPPPTTRTFIWAPVGGLVS